MARSTNKFYTGYGDTPNEIDPGIDCATAEKNGDLSQTIQSEKDACDINRIVDRYQRTGILTHTRDAIQARYGDFSNIPDFHEAQNIVAQANQLFMQMPAQIRSRFQNDAGNFLNFFQDPNNQEEAIKLGLATKPVITGEPLKATAPAQPPVAAPAATPSPSATTVSN